MGECGQKRVSAKDAILPTKSLLRMAERWGVMGAEKEKIYPYLPRKIGKEKCKLETFWARKKKTQIPRGGRTRILMARR